MIKSVWRFIQPTIFFLCLIPNVSAHGGGDNDGLTNLQVLLISIAISGLFYFLHQKFLTGKSNITSIVASLAMFSALVHVLLGLKNELLLVGGIGVLAILVAQLVSDSIKSYDKILQGMLGIVISIMFVAYFVSNHDLHYIMEDYLGITTKLAELGVIFLLLKNLRQNSESVEPIA